MGEQRWEKWELVLGEDIPPNAQARLAEYQTCSFHDWYTTEELESGRVYAVTETMISDWEFRIPALPEPPKIIPHIPWLQSVVATFDESDRIEFQRRLVDLGNWVVAKKQENEQRKEVTA